MSWLRTIVVGLLLMRANPIAAQEQVQPTSEDGSLSRFEFLQIRMAIPVRITVYAADEATANLATDRAYARFKELDRMLSDFDPDSELSSLCRNAHVGVPSLASPELFTVLQQAERVSRQSGGAFDVTVGPVTELWRKVRRRKVLPPEEERLAALSRVGWQHVELGELRQSVTLKRPGMKLDLGGIAKGFAADEALRVMAERAGVTIALVDAGGDVVAGDPPPGEANWTIGIAPLDAPRGDPDRLLSLRNMAVATSGDASQHVEIDGVRYSHIVNPATGMGVTTPSSVTVIAGDGTTADALASAVSVLGPDKGVALIEQIDGAETCIVTRSGDGQIHVTESSGFDRFVRPTSE